MTGWKVEVDAAGKGRGENRKRRKIGIREAGELEDLGATGIT